MNLILGALNELKQLRNDLQADPSKPFERSDIVRNAPAGTILAVVGGTVIEPNHRNRNRKIRNPYATGSPEQGKGCSMPGGALPGCGSVGQ